MLIMAITALSCVMLWRVKLLLLCIEKAVVIGTGLETFADLTSRQLKWSLVVSWWILLCRLLCNA